MSPADLQRFLQLKTPHRLDGDIAEAAAVGLILRGWGTELELGFIRRPVSPTDPWSGQIAFPGGRHEADDADLFASALREIREEVGWNIDRQRLLGTLADVQARKSGVLLPFFIRPFVFDGEGLPAPEIGPSEVDEFLWVPFKTLVDPAKHVDFPWQRGAVKAALPGIRLTPKDILWGLSYMILTDFVFALASRNPGFFPKDPKTFWRLYGA